MTRSKLGAFVLLILIGMAGTRAFGAEDSAVKFDKVYINEALTGLSFDIKQGEIVSILGPSGSGKSTLINIITGLLPPTKGKYILNGKDLGDLSADERKKTLDGEIGYITYPPDLDPKKTVLETLGARLSPGKIPTVKIDPRIQEMLALVGLEKFGRTKPDQLSGGQQQRVAIARALVHDPSIILADEPTGNLDQKAADGILDLLRELRSEDKTLILVTHELGVAEMADRIISLSAKSEEDDRHDKHK